MITIEITIDGATYSVQREALDVKTAYDDFLNLLFLSGADLADLAELLGRPAEAQKNNHDPEQDQPVSSPCNI